VRDPISLDAHVGQGAAAATAFGKLSATYPNNLLAFLQSL
jgi:hypothetical protein